MGNAYQDELTAEEKEILGETEPESTEAKTDEGTGTLDTEAPAQETEKPTENAPAPETTIDPNKLTDEEKKDIETQGFRIETVKNRTYIVDSEGTKIPEARFGKFYREGKEAETLRRENEEIKQKHDLLRQLGPDEFYKLYPDDAPQGYRAPERKAAIPVPANQNVLNMTVTGGEYDGMTLRDVMQSNPEEGTRMFNEWKDAQYQATIEQEHKVSQTKMEEETEVFNFGMARAKELFGIDDANQLTPEHNRKLVLLGQEVLSWQKETNRMGLSWEDAYRLMKHDDLIKKAREEGSKATFQELQKKGPASINTGDGGDNKPSGWEEVAAMTEKELTKHIDNLNDADYKKFFKTAPASIKAKYPGMPWD